MEIKRIGENKIRCALTEEEIQGMGFEIDDIIGNGETTQQFMRLVLNLVEEQENISLETISPMVKAELLADHSMAITFGGDSDMSFKDLVSTVGQLLNQLPPEKMEEFKGLSREEKQSAVDSFLEGLDKKTEKKQPSKGERQERRKIRTSMVCALRFQTLDDAIRMSRVCFFSTIPKSRLYKLEGAYYLIMDFTGFSKETMRPFAFGAVEYDDGRISDMMQISHIIEHGVCIAKKDALQMLMQL